MPEPTLVRHCCSDSTAWLAVLVPLLPLLAFAVNALFGRRVLRHWTGWIASGALLASALCTTALFLRPANAAVEIVNVYRWIGAGDFTVDVSVQIDQLSTVMMLVVSWGSFLIPVYSNGYSQG